MKKKIIIQTALLMFMSSLLISCDKSQPIPNLLNQHVVLADGVNFDSGELVVLDPFTGKLVQPCEKSMIKENNPPAQAGAYQSDSSKTEKQNNPKCDSQVIDPSASLQSALNSSDKVIEGTILKNGKKIPTRFVITVRALFEGSYCQTTFGSGQQYEQCIKSFPRR